MPVEYFLRYRGICYNVGTRLKFKPSYWSDPIEGKVEYISHHTVFIQLTDGSKWKLSKVQSLDNTITEIIEPVYYEEHPIVYKRSGAHPSEESVFIGWVWYIAIMLIGVIFKDKFTIWVFATAAFFLWKNGFLNGGKK